MTADLTKPLALLPGDNHVRSATITATEEASSHDADQLKVPSYAETYRSTSVSADRRVDFDLGSLVSDIDVIALFGVNLTDAATVRFYGDNGAGFPSPEHDSGDLAAFNTSLATWADGAPPWGRPVVYLPAGAWSARYVRVELTDTGNPDGFLEAAYAFIGPARQAGTFAAAGWTPGLGWVGPPGRQVRVLSHALTLLALAEQGRAQWMSLASALQGSGRFGLVPRPAVAGAIAHEAVLARLTAYEQALVREGEDDPLWNVTLRSEEVYT